MVKSWQYQDYPNADDIINKKCEIVLWSILNSPHGEFIKNIKDTRSIHKILFEKLINAEQKYFAGHYRGDNYPGLINRVGSRRIELFPGLFIKHRFTEPKNVIYELDILNNNIDYLYAKRNVIEKQKYYSLAVEVLIRFYLIHPYVNGNGHIGRVIMTYLMRIAGIDIDKSWTIHPRPYTNAIAVCMFTHSKYPIVAEQYFQQWFHVPNNSAGSINLDTDICYQDFFDSSNKDSNSNSDSDQQPEEDSDSDSGQQPEEDSDSDSGQQPEEDSDSDSGQQPEEDSDSDSDQQLDEKSRSDCDQQLNRYLDFDSCSPLSVELRRDTSHFMNTNRWQ